MEEDIKICPNCGLEYYSFAEECADCLVKLIPKIKSIEKNNTLESSDELILIRTDESLLIKDLQNKLLKIGVESIINVESEHKHKSSHGHFGRGSYYSLFVSKENETKVREFEKKLLNEELKQDHLTINYDPNADNNQHCPACQSFIGINVKECPSCGLILIGEDE